MAYTGSQSLGNFWDTMMKLRGQRLEEQEIEAKLRDAQQARMMEMGQKASSQIGESILGGMKQRRQDALANTMLNEGLGGGTVPRAEAVGGISPEARAAAMKQFGGPTSPHAGGMDELALRMQMEKAQQANLAERALTDYRKISTAKQAWSMAPDLNKKFNITNAYTKQMDVLNETMTKALETRDKALYDNTGSAMNTLHEAYTETNPNTKTPPPQIPPFVHPDDLKAIGDAKQAITGLQSQLAGTKEEPGWFSSIIPEGANPWASPKGDTLRSFGGNKSSIDALKEQIRQKQEAMKALPGMEEYQKFQQRNIGASTGNKEGQIVGGWPLGKKTYNQQTKQWAIWDGTEWKIQ
jgi:hypothetical protein